MLRRGQKWCMDGGGGGGWGDGGDGGDVGRQRGAEGGGEGARLRSSPTLSPRPGKV